MSLIKDSKEIQLIRESSKIVGDVLKHLKDFIKVGISTAELDRIAEEFILSRGGYPAFKGYKVKRSKFPASLCISINDEVVHGIPSDKRFLNEGDIVSVDVGVKKNGYFGDGAYTFGVGKVSDRKKKLIKITEESLYKGIEKAIEGNTINDISCAVQNYVEGSGLSVVRELVGHGIGSSLHEEPAVPNFYSSANTTKLLNGMTLAIEPMVNYGSFSVYTKNDGWTVVTSDGEPSAHYEHTVLITDGKPEILTI
jgi:methionyl aminopeptidase